MKSRIVSILLLVLVLASCANRGIGPQGGPKDSIPPVPLKAEPVNGAVNFNGKRIEVTFNEYLQLDNVSQHLMMSPPQQKPPEVKARGKKLVIQFVDSLRDSTTYTLDFGDAVCDYNEKVPYHNYSFAFSTGPTIDTLETYGRVYDASNNDPRGGIMVGIHSDFSDTAFTKHPFLRIAKTDSAGFFRIGNMRAGKYRLYAVDDVSRDYRLTLGEAHAFADEFVTTGDTTALYLFKPEQRKLYLLRTLREQRHLVKVLFSSPPDSLPQFRCLNDTVHFHTQFSAHADTVQLWLTDSSSISVDSLFFEARFRRTDSLFRLEWATDTLRAIWRTPRMTAKALEAEHRKNRNRRLELKTNASNAFELNDTLKLRCTTPIKDINLDKIHIVECVDSLRNPVPFEIAPHDTLPMQLVFLATMQPGKAYELKLDSGSLHDVYDVTHVAGTYPLQLKTPEDYAKLLVRLNPFVLNARIQLLNNRDEVIREMPADLEGTLFDFLKADTYYMRFYIDANGDRKWTPGCWEERRQPEEVFYNPNSIQTKSNWDFEEEWDYTLTPKESSKPRELIGRSSSKK